VVNAEKRLDAGSMLVMLITLVLFVAALFIKGPGHDLLLEAGVFLVSVKLMIVSQRNAISSERILEELRMIVSTLESRESARGGRDQGGEPSRARGVKS
jgi:hypothetical protein